MKKIILMCSCLLALGSIDSTALAISSARLAQLKEQQVMRKLKAERSAAIARAQSLRVPVGLAHELDAVLQAVYESMLKQLRVLRAGKAHLGLKRYFLKRSAIISEHRQRAKELVRLHLLYRPEGNGYFEAKDHFESLQVQELSDIEMEFETLAIQEIRTTGAESEVTPPPD